MGHICKKSLNYIVEGNNKNVINWAAFAKLNFTFLQRDCQAITWTSNDPVSWTVARINFNPGLD